MKYPFNNDSAKYGGRNGGASTNTTAKGTLTYFGVYARAEPIRMLLNHARVDFEDRRISFEEWGALKSQMPAGQIPVWEENGKIYN